MGQSKTKTPRTSRTSMKLAALLVGVGVGLPACGGSNGAGTPGMDAAATETGTLGKDAGAAAYPPGPYAVGPGSVVEDATFLGYRRFDDRVLREIAFHDYYDPQGTKTTSAGVPATTLLVTAGAVWCNPCVQEAKV